MTSKMTSNDFKNNLNDISNSLKCSQMPFFVRLFGTLEYCCVQQKIPAILFFCQIFTQKGLQAAFFFKAPFCSSFFILKQTEFQGGGGGQKLRKEQQAAHTTTIQYSLGMCIGTLI